MGPINYFEFISVPKIVFGEGSVNRIGNTAIATGGKTAIIVADRYFVDNGTAARIEESIKKEGLQSAGVFTDIPVDSDMETVRKGYEMAVAAVADLVVAIGGGSAIDTAKGIRVMMAENGKLPEGVNVIKGKLPPMIAIPTTAGTGSESTSAAVIHDRKRGMKISFTDQKLMPTIAVLDPTVTVSLPPALTAATGMDALAHCVESMQSVMRQPISDGLALESASIIATALPAAIKNPEDKKARGLMQLAATMAGMAFSNTLVGIVHACAHACGASYGVPHGVACGILLPYGMAFNLDTYAGEAYARLAHAMDVCAPGGDHVESAKAAIAFIRKLSLESGLPSSLKEAGVPEDGIKTLVDKASMDGSMMTTPKQASDAELTELFMKAWRGDAPVDGAAASAPAAKTAATESTDASAKAADESAPTEKKKKSPEEFTVDDMYKVAEKFIGKLFGNETIVEPLQKSGLKMRFIYFNENWGDEEAILTVDCAEKPIAIHKGANSPVEPVVSMRMSSETARLFWLQKINLMSAISKGDITVTGAINEAMRLLPVIKPAYAMFKEL